MKIGTKEKDRQEPEVESAIWLRQDEERRRYVQRMFAAIANRYDLLNSVLSLRLHHAWRRRAVRMAQLKPGDCALDVCTGTGDFALELAKAVGSEGQVFGVDFCEPMLAIARQKATRARLNNLHWVLADALDLPFPDNAFAAITIGFGIRNIIDPAAALQEMARVTKPGGRVLCLELNRPQGNLIRPLYDFYALKVLPRIGGLLSRRDAYEYLPNSIQNFLDRETLSELMKEAGLCQVKYRDLTLGVVCLHLGVKSCPA